jgi:hypothetical protein
LVVLDFTMQPNMPDIDTSIKCAADIAHASPENIILMLYPVHAKALSLENNLKTRRRIEDQMIKHQLNMEAELGISCNVSAQHGNDKRKLIITGRLVVSARNNAGSRWHDSEVYVSGKLDQVPLSRPCDVSPLRMPGEVGPSARQFTPSERAFVKGSAAVVHIIKGLLKGVRMENTKLIVADLMVGPTPDWVTGVWELQKAWLANTTNGDPLVAYLGFAPDVTHKVAITTYLEKELMDNWWDDHADAGPKEPTMDLTRTEERPALKLAAWVGDMPKLPAMVRDKFTSDDTTYFTAWQDECKRFEAAVNRAVTAAGLVDVTTPTAILNPDWSVAPLRPDLAKVISLTPTTAADFKSDDVSAA